MVAYPYKFRTFLYITDKVDFMNDILNFYNNIDKIKHKEREGWKRIGIKGVKDTIASHSFGSSLIAWIMAEKEGYDSSKLIKMLLMHDLIMAYVDDYVPGQEGYKNKRNIENELAKKLLSSVPDEIKKEFTALFEEYQEEKTEYAVFARECDKLDTILQAFMYSKRLGNDSVSEFIKTNEKKIKSKTGKEILKSLKS